MASDEDFRLAELMRAALLGDETAYATFLRRAAELTRRVVTRRLKSTWPSGIEDVVQETLLAIHLKRHTWRTAEPILPWLTTIARYKAIDACRRRGFRVEMPIEDFAEVLAGPDERASIEETQHMEMAVGTLSGGQQRVVRAIALEGRSIKETAQALGHEGNGGARCLPPRTFLHRPALRTPDMKTDDLIASLTAGQRRQPPPARLFAWAVAAAGPRCGTMVLLSIGLRPDFAAALVTWRFDMKFVVTLTLSASAFFLLRSAHLSRRAGAGTPVGRSCSTRTSSRRCGL